MRLSRGRSTPTRRAMWRFPYQFHRGVCRDASRPSSDGLRPSAPEVIRWTWCPAKRSRLRLFSCAAELRSALALLVARVLADHHDAAVATDHLALVTDGLDAGLDLHGGRSFPNGWLLVAVDDPTSCEVIRRELHHHAVLREDADVVLAHLAADVGEHLVTIAQLHAEHRIGQGFSDRALELDHAFFLRHVLTNCSSVNDRSTREPPPRLRRWTSRGSPTHRISAQS